jgi:ATP-dependent Clp protease ATP-binding subunit ClpC
VFSRYTESARRALFFSRYEASQLGSRLIDPEHLLLGLLRDGAVVNTLLTMPPEHLRRDVASRIPFQEKLSTSVEIPIGAAAMRVLAFAEQEADACGCAQIGSEHLLLGLLRDDQSGAATVLVSQGVQFGDLRRAVEQLPAPLEGDPDALLGGGGIR